MPTKDLEARYGISGVSGRRRRPYVFRTGAARTWFRDTHTAQAERPVAKVDAQAATDWLQLALRTHLELPKETRRLMAEFAVRDPGYVTLMQEVARLQARIEALEAAQQLEPQVIVLREISREEAKKEVAALFEQGGVWYYSDIARDLRLDLEMVVELCQELMDEGAIYVPGAESGE